MKSNTGLKVYTDADFPKTPPCTLGERVSLYINRLDELKPREQNAWNYMLRLHGSDKLWKAYEDYVEKRGKNK